MKQIFICLMFILVTTSCSKFKKVGDTNSKDAPSKTKSLDKELDSLDILEDNEFVKDADSKKNESDDIDNLLAQDSAAFKGEGAMGEETKNSMQTPSLLGGATTFTTAKKETPATYNVQKGDTLMLISYKIYGHHREWKNLWKLNRDKIKNFKNLVSGVQITYYPPLTEAVKPTGNPYLILSGDTLGKISKKVFQSKKHWRSIWKNNSLLIDNPNLIFAGFTIFTPLSLQPLGVLQKTQGIQNTQIEFANTTKASNLELVEDVIVRKESASEK